MMDWMFDVKPEFDGSATGKAVTDCIEKADPVSDVHVNGNWRLTESLLVVKENFLRRAATVSKFTSSKDLRDIQSKDPYLPCKIQ